MIRKKNSASNIKREWHLLDAKDQVLGRLASRAAELLSGKHKVEYTPHLDVGDHVVVINAAEVKVTGKKAKEKLYYRHSGYPGGLKIKSFEELLEEKPEEIIIRAVRGMLPKNRLRAKRLRRLHVFAGSDHDYQDKFSQKE